MAVLRPCNDEGEKTGILNQRSINRNLAQKWEKHSLLLSLV